MKKYKLNLHINIKDRVFLFFIRIPVLNKIYKNTETRIDDILDNYIHDFVVYLFNKGWDKICTCGDSLGIDSNLLKEVYKRCLKIKPNLSYDNFLYKVDDSIEVHTNGLNLIYNNGDK